ncbi:S26 family signal peptidase (plasmid) [Cetobacterium somerae]|uniref:S26 family signal peptidase n=1 Tax=Cetobacterium somerae TaxID=188913 RepID=UPI003D767E64
MRKKISVIATSLLLYLFIKEVNSRYFVLNLSPSMEKGLYFLRDVDELKKGDVVVLNIPLNVKETLYSRGYLPKNIKTLLKEIVAVEGDIIDIAHKKLYINGELKGDIAEVDPRGRKLVSFAKNGALKKDEVFLLGRGENSFDSRYFGTIEKSEILKKTILIKEF